MEGELWTAPHPRKSVPITFSRYREHLGSPGALEDVISAVDGVRGGEPVIIEYYL